MNETEMTKSEYQFLKTIEKLELVVEKLEAKVSERNAEIKSLNETLALVRGENNRLEDEIEEFYSSTPDIIPEQVKEPEPEAKTVEITPDMLQLAGEQLQELGTEYITGLQFSKTFREDELPEPLHAVLKEDTEHSASNGVFVISPKSSGIYILNKTNL